MRNDSQSDALDESVFQPTRLTYGKGQQCRGQTDSVKNVVERRFVFDKVMTMMEADAHAGSKGM